MHNSRLAWLIPALGVLGLSCSTLPLSSMCGHGSGHVLDEAKCVGRDAGSFPAADEDYFRDMDYGVTKSPLQVAAALAPYVPNITPDQAVSAAVKGRNNWIVWSGGNDRLWDTLSVQSAGILDFLKTVSNHPSLQYSRDNRWRYLGLVNEPCFDKATGPRKDRYGLWLDVRSEACPPDPFENETKYPGVKIGARGKNAPVGSYYGYATGVVGLRLFPNPDFDEAAAKRWDPERYYNDPSLLQRQETDQALPGRHVLRLLSRRTEPEQPARRSGASQMGEPQLQSRCAVFLGRPNLCLERGRIELCLSAVPHLAPRRARYLVCFHRLHEQPADHERGLQLRRADGVGKEMGQGGTRRR